MLKQEVTRAKKKIQETKIKSAQMMALQQLNDEKFERKIKELQEKE